MQTTKSRNGPSSSPNQNKNQKNRGSKSTERASPRNPVSEKQTSKVSEMESQLAQLQEELKRAKDQLTSLETQKKRAQQETEEARKQISSLSAKLEESQQQLIELSDTEAARLHELRKLSQERDRSWESELESLQKQHTADTAALSSAMNEVQRLKKQLDATAESEATQSRHAESAHVEIKSLRIELSETLDLVQEMKNQLADAKESESRALEVVSETKMQLKAAKEAAEAIRSDSLEVKEAYNSLASELEQSKAQANTLELLVSKLEEKDEHKDEEEAEKLKMEIDSLKLEAGKLKTALEASEARYQNEYIQSTLQIRSAYEEVERAKSESSLKEAALMEELKKAKEAIEELKYDLLDKETQLQTLAEENEVLRTEIHDRGNVNERGVVLVVDEAEQLCMEKAELEAELRMVKVQADQWRKAAEAAAAMLSPECEAKAVDRTVSVDINGMKKMDSHFSDNINMDDDKKKNANMLKKIGGLWKKGQK